MEEELVRIFMETLRTARFIGGPEVEGFERDFARFCGSRYCAGVGSGTDALRFALIAAGVNAGDTVITVPNTFIATSEAISQAGAVPDFVDVDQCTCNMNPARLEEYLEAGCRRDGRTGRLISRRTRGPVTAVVAVHLYGQMADMDPLTGLAAKYGLAVIEDACQAHGARYYSKRMRRWITAGSAGAAAAFSFYPGKNLGACGEAGAVTTGDAATDKTVRMLRDHGQVRKYHHEMEGYNGRLDAMQAGFLRFKLGRLAEWNRQRRENALRYKDLLGGISGVFTPFEPGWSRAVYHLFVIHTKRRDPLRAWLAENGIQTGLHYPVPLHLQHAYRGRGYKKGDFPVSEKLAREGLSLPMYPGLAASHQEHVAQKIRDFLIKFRKS